MKKSLVPVLLLCALRAAGEPRSGFEYLSPENQALQQDEFANPGYLWVESGERLFHAGDDGPSCASCHAANELAGVMPAYPRHDEDAGKLISLEQQVNECRVERQHQPAWKHESREMLATTAYIGNLAKGRVIDRQVTEETRPFFEAGKRFFYRRRGQLNLSCANCHEQFAGARLRGERISEGHTNGFPVYRHTWETLGSTHRMFRWCNEAVRAEPYPYDSDEYVNLEFFLRVRSSGLEIETPAVRR